MNAQMTGTTLDLEAIGKRLRILPAMLGFADIRPLLVDAEALKNEVIRLIAAQTGQPDEPEGLPEGISHHETDNCYEKVDPDRPDGLPWMIVFLTKDYPGAFSSSDLRAVAADMDRIDAAKKAKAKGPSALECAQNLRRQAAVVKSAWKDELTQAAEKLEEFALLELEGK